MRVRRLGLLAPQVGLDADGARAYREIAAAASSGAFDPRPSWLARMTAPGFAPRDPDGAARVLGWLDVVAPDVLCAELIATADAPDLRPQRLGDHAERFHSLFREIGIGGHHQLRVLICDGPRQLAWVGRNPRGVLHRRERTLLRRLTRPLGQRLGLEKQLAAPALLAAALDAALEALPTAAFVMGPKLAIEIANRPGIALLERDRAGVLVRLRTWRG